MCVRKINHSLIVGNMIRTSEFCVYFIFLTPHYGMELNINQFIIYFMVVKRLTVIFKTIDNIFTKPYIQQMCIM